MITTITIRTEKQVIEKIIKELQSNTSERGIDAYKYCGIINLKNDPVVIQKMLRDEWK
ncbi:MAG: hypothetical protein K8S16_09760 [Bacteroidales bacterium]|nr:hypothetical protein [Bacteroidales bacterium]